MHLVLNLASNVTKDVGRNWLEVYAIQGFPGENELKSCSANILRLGFYSDCKFYI